MVGLLLQLPRRICQSNCFLEQYVKWKSVVGRHTDHFFRTLAFRFSTRLSGSWLVVLRILVLGCANRLGSDRLIDVRLLFWDQDSSFCSFRLIVLRTLVHTSSLCSSRFIVLWTVVRTRSLGTPRWVVLTTPTTPTLSLASRFSSPLRSPLFCASLFGGLIPQHITGWISKWILDLGIRLDIDIWFERLNALPCSESLLWTQCQRE